MIRKFVAQRARKNYNVMKIWWKNKNRQYNWLDLHYAMLLKQRCTSIKDVENVVNLLMQTLKKWWKSDEKYCKRFSVHPIDKQNDFNNISLKNKETGRLILPKKIDKQYPFFSI
jgi:hypothetical protein